MIFEKSSKSTEHLRSFLNKQDFQRVPGWMVAGIMTADKLPALSEQIHICLG